MRQSWKAKGYMSRTKSLAPYNIPTKPQSTNGRCHPHDCQAEHKMLHWKVQMLMNILKIPHDFTRAFQNHFPFRGRLTHNGQGVESNRGRRHLNPTNLGRNFLVFRNLNEAQEKSAKKKSDCELESNGD
mmetsp:Transcript_8976/g.13888  ORF Transcript_8976/g.13888 Transcript_8976/m.13888 type:complete len:129 (+) Transcript_8976:698-1084(+)